MLRSESEIPTFFWAKGGDNNALLRAPLSTPKPRPILIPSDFTPKSGSSFEGVTEPRRSENVLAKKVVYLNTFIYFRFRRFSDATGKNSARSCVLGIAML